MLDSSNNVLDYCASNSSSSFVYATSASQWVSMLKKGVVSFSFKLDYADMCGNPAIKPL